jgi:5-methylcytosine-specific restriction endonuclease McrA
MIRLPVPTPAEQVTFLGHIERLLSEGQFVATYKYALLVAIADLAVQLGHDDGSELDLPVRLIAEQFVELYWRHGAPYGRGVADGAYNILMQNTGQQASMIAIIEQLRATSPTLATARASKAWRGAVTRTEQLIVKMPLWRLQVLRNEKLEFLYAKSPIRGNIRLKPGVSAILRRFHGMIIRLAQSEWLRFIRALPSNEFLLGATSDLGRFLFGAERGAVIRMAESLADIQGGLCFYCRTRVNVGEVDHFVPWSRYPRDLAHNLVLAHQQCNRQKSDLLAAEDHLDRWMERNHKHGFAICEAGARAGITVDLPATVHVAAWAYAHGAALRASAWVARDTVEHLTDHWQRLLVHTGQ